MHTLPNVHNKISLSANIFVFRYYLTWPVSVDVKINYNKTILFPAVTICNENAFR